MAKSYNSRKSYRKKSSRYSKKGSKRGPTTKTLSKKIRHIENDLIELRYVDCTTVGTSDEFDSDGSTYSLFVNLIQGTGDNEYIGNNINPTSVQLRGSVFADPAVNGPTVCRLMLLWDKQANGDPPLIAPTIVGVPDKNSILDNTGGGITAIVPLVYSPYSYEAQDRFTVIWDKTYIVNPQYISDVGPLALVGSKGFQFDERIKLGRKVKFGADDTAGIPITNNLLFVIMSDIVNGGGEPNIQFCTRVYYRDA